MDDLEIRAAGVVDTTGENYDILVSRALKRNERTIPSRIF
jgi:hypothetical protein